MASDQDRKTVKVGCRIPNGLSLRLFKQGYDDGTGFKPMVVDGPAVELKGPHPLSAGVFNTGMDPSEPGYAEVDAEFFARWLEQNAKSSAVTMGMVFEVKPEKAKDDDD